MKTGVLFIHGFTGGTYEVQPLVTFCEKAYRLVCGSTDIAGAWSHT